LESGSHRGSSASSLQNALGLFAEVRQNRVGVIFYGDEITSTANDREKFATYTRDSYTGLDYADQRYFASTYGRFNTADPYQASGGPSEPSSWNRYSYTRGDPANRVDPSGQDDCETGGGDPWACLYGEGGDGEASDPIGGGPIYYGACAGMAEGFAPAAGVSCVSDGAGGVVPATTAPPPQPDCFAQLKDRPVDVPIARLANAYHSFWWIQDSTGLQEIISAGPQNGYLNTFLVPGQSNGPDNAGDSTVWSSGDSSAVCSQVNALEAAAKGFPNNTITYSPFPGPNSNSVAHYLAQAGGFAFSVPGNLYGWSVGILSPSPGKGGPRTRRGIGITDPRQN
jgi:RHS repeat-associated protein